MKEHLKWESKIGTFLFISLHTDNIIHFHNKKLGCALLNKQKFDLLYVYIFIYIIRQFIIVT